MDQWLTLLLKNDLNEYLPLILKIVFLALWFFTTLVIFSAPLPGKKIKVNYVLLGWIFCGSLLAILIYQATWQLGGMARPRFVSYLRSHNRRSNAAEQQSLRGPIFDRRGMVLAAPRTGSIWERRYPLGEAAAHPLGYYHPRYGLTAVERICDSRLSGVIKNKEQLAHSLLGRRAEQGESLTLTLDSRLQKLAYDLLKKRRGAVVVLNPRNGDLLALVSSPGFDPADPGSVLHATSTDPLFNRAVQGAYPPGSTFKIVTAGAALCAGISPTYNCPGGGFIADSGTRAIRDSEYYSAHRKGETWRGWGSINMKEAMVHSSNVYFAQLGAACTAEQLCHTFNQLHIGRKIAYMHDAEESLATNPGQVPSLKSRWNRAQAAIGQGDLLVSPLHVACFTAAAANRGALCAPRLNAASPVVILSEPFTPAAAYTLKVLLREAVRRGTGRRADLAGLDVCGKTGTAQIGSGRDHAWFTCFAPFAEPAIVVTVLVENGGFGAAAALPIARELLLNADRLGLVQVSGRRQ